MGIKTKKYKNGEVYQGQIKSNKRHGYGTHEWPDHRIYEGQWADDMMNGHGIYSWTKDNRTYEGRFVNDNMTGQGWYQETDRVIVGEFQNGVLHGRGVQFSSEGAHKTRIIVGNSWFLGDLLSGFEIVMGKDEVVESLKQHKKMVTKSVASSSTAKDTTTVHTVISFVDKSALDSVKQETTTKTKLTQQIMTLERKLEKCESQLEQQETQIREHEGEKKQFQQYVIQVNQQFIQQKQLMQQFEQLMTEREQQYLEQIRDLNQQIESMSVTHKEREDSLLSQLDQVENQVKSYEQTVQNYEKQVEQCNETILTQKQELLNMQQVINEQLEQLTVMEHERDQMVQRIAEDAAARSRVVEVGTDPNKEEKCVQTDLMGGQYVSPRQRSYSCSSSESNSPLTSPRGSPRSNTSITPRGFANAIIETSATPRVSENPFVKMSRVSSVDGAYDPSVQYTPRGVNIKSGAPTTKEEMSKVVDFRAHLRKTNLLENLEKKKQEPQEKDESIIDFRAHLRNK